MWGKVKTIKKGKKYWLWLKKLKTIKEIEYEKDMEALNRRGRIPVKAQENIAHENYLPYICGEA